MLQNKTKKISCLGYSILEVLIALFILSFALLALTRFNIAAWQRLTDSYFSCFAISAAINRLEAGIAGDGGLYHKNWQGYVAGVLPKGSGSYQAAAYSSKVTVCWQQMLWRHEFCYALSF